MDFFSRQEQSRRTSRFLVVAFTLAFATVVISTTVAAGAVLRIYWTQAGPYGGQIQTAQTFGQWATANLGLLGTIAGGTLLLILLATGYRTASLSGGGGQVARMLNATQVTGDGGDLLRKRLINVVEEMAIASGLPMPEVYVLEHEPAINAFASGLTPGDAAITVTRGALERLNRAELQGVVGHEFSHILNGDMRLNQRLIGLCFGILVLSLVGRWLLRAAAYGSWGGYARYGNRRGRGGGVNAAFAIGLAVAVIGGIGLLASRLIKAAVSRQREALADASAVQFTRDPAGLAGALKKIGGFTSTLSSVDGEEVAHMLFDHGAALGGLFATHPPLLQRIRALDPTFDPNDYRPEEAPLAPPPEEEPAAAASGAAAGLAPAADGHYAAAALAERPAAAAAPRRPDAHEALLASTGALGSPALGGALRAAVPRALHAAAHSKDESLLLILALALSPDAGVRRQQDNLLASQLGAARARRCGELYTELAALDPKLRIPVLELAVPALKQRPTEQIEYLFALLERLAELESERRLFDYVLLRMLHAYLSASPAPPPRAGARAAAKRSPAAALSGLLATVAAFGHEDGTTALGAYEAGLAAAGLDDGRVPAPDFTALPPLRDLTQFDAALAQLTKLKPAGKRQALEAVLATIRYDKVLDVDETELFRAIAATLGCPVPPVPELGIG